MTKQDEVAQRLNAPDIARGVIEAFAQINATLGCWVTQAEISRSRIFGDWLAELCNHVGQGGTIDQYLFAKLQAERQKLGDVAGSQWIHTVLKNPNIPVVIPYSIHAKVFSTKIEYNEEKTADEMVRWFRDLSYRGLAIKTSSKLIEPVHSRGGHKIVDVISPSGMVLVDAEGKKDKPAPPIDYAVERLRDLQAYSVVYSSAHHLLKGDDRFRVVVFLDQLVEFDTYRRTQRAVCRLISGRDDWYGDTSKAHPYSLFYLPATYAVTRNHNRFEVIEGNIYSPDFWCQASPEPEPPPRPQPKPKLRTARTIPADTAFEAWSEQSFDEEKDQIAGDYRSLASDRYQGLFKAAVKIAGSAVFYGYDLSAGEFSGILRDLYSDNPGSSPRKNFDKMADDALNATRGGNQHSRVASNNLRRQWNEGCGPQTIDEFMKENSGK
jgi:hypothetical protein